MPSRPVVPSLALAAMAVAVLACALLSHWLMLHWPGEPWAVAVIFAPLLLALAAGGLRRRHGPTLLGCALAVLLLAAVVLRGGSGVNRLYLFQHAGIHAALAWMFGSTLRPGATPLISALAQRLHTVFSPAQRAWTARLTAVWTGYFVAMVLLSLALYAWAPWALWSLFANVLTPLSAAALFIGEPLLRRWRHPEFERVTLAGAVQAYRSHGAG